MIVTQEWLNAWRTPKGGFTRLQLACLGVSWPPSCLWHKQVIGMDISDDVVKAFVDARLKRKSGIPYATEKSKPGIFADQRARHEKAAILSENDVCEGMMPIKVKKKRHNFNPERQLWK